MHRACAGGGISFALTWNATFRNGPRLAAETLRRLWTMLAHRQGAPLNVAELARSLSVDGRTVSRYVDLLVDLLLVRRLPAWHANVGKRLVKSPRIYLRDSGLVHALLGIEDLEGLLSHPVAGAPWEGFVIENVLAAAPQGVEAYFYRTSGGAEIDLALVFPNRSLWALEIKRAAAPAISRGFHEACEDLRPKRCFVVHSGGEPYPLAPRVEAVSLREIVQTLQKTRSPH